MPLPHKNEVTYLKASHGARRPFIGKKVLLWERLSASIVAAGKPLPQKMAQLINGLIISFR
jgi:hypothetical protein